MKKNPLISVIIPVYKVEKYLAQCLDSVLNQTYGNLEIVLVDDGSPDSCPQICDEYGVKDARVHVIHKKNGGLASARNVGLDHASGEFVSFIDSDDWIEKETYEKIMQVQEETLAEIIMFDIIQTDGMTFFDKFNYTRETGRVVAANEIVKQILLDKIGSEVVKAVYDIKCWEGIRFPFGRLYEDIPTTYHVYEKASKVAFVNEPLYKYRVNKSSISYTPNPIKPYHFYLGYREHFEYARKHYPDIVRRVGANAAHYAISMYFHACTDAIETLTPYKPEVELFLDENKKYFNMNEIMRSRRIMLKLFYFSKSLFKLVCKIINKTKVQKILNLEVK